MPATSPNPQTFQGAMMHDSVVILWQLSNWGRRKTVMELQDVTKLSWKFELKETQGSSGFQTVFSSRTLSLSPKGKCSWQKGTVLAEARGWEWSVDSHLAFPGFLCRPFKRIKGSEECGLNPLFNSNTSTLQSRELRHREHVCAGKTGDSSCS